MTKPAGHNSRRLVSAAQAIAPVLAIVVLLTFPLVLRAELHFSPDQVQRNERIRAAFEEAPWSIGRWRAEPVELPGAAEAILNPNAVISRRYREMNSNRSAMLLIVHCTDVRDMAGHYPRVCYPNAGWSLRGEQFSSVAVGQSGQSIELELCQYRFDRRIADSDVQVLRVRNFFVLPDGRTATDARELSRLASRAATAVSGVAQIQIVFDSSIDEADESEVMRELLSGMASVLMELGLELR